MKRLRYIILFFFLYSYLACNPVTTTKEASQPPSSTTPPKTSPPSSPVEKLPWQTVDLGKLLVSRDLSEFSSAGTIGKGHKKDVFQDDKNPSDKYVFTKGYGWLEAYAGTVHHFLLGKYSTFEQFVEDKTSGSIELWGASRLDPTYKDAFSYHLTDKNPLLPAGSGLGRIIVASMLLAEIDLKGVASNDSNLGIVEHGGKKYYFKIDHGQSFWFNNSATKDNFNLADLKTPQENMKYLEWLRFEPPSLHLSPELLSEIRAAAEEFAAIPEATLDKVLDFCESELKKLPVYPNDDQYLGISKKSGGSGFRDGVLKKKGGYKTFKEAIKARFAELRDVLKS